MAEIIFATRDITKQYDHSTVVSHVNMAVEKGQIYGLVGRNGAGKTTIIRMLAAQVSPTSGEVELFGATAEKGLSEGRSHSGAMIETPSFYPYFNARQNLEYYRVQRGIPGSDCVEEALDLVGLTNVGTKKFKQFSLGMKQRLGLALALLNQPELLLLDEPINGLDPEGIVEFRNLLLTLNRQKGVTILISSHILSELSNLATYYGFLDGGRMVEQISAVDLHDKCRAYLQLTVDAADRASLILEEGLQCRDYEVLPNHVIRLYGFLDEPQKVTEALVTAGVGVLGIESKGTDLEQYFLRLVGGAAHA